MLTGSLRSLNPRNVVRFSRWRDMSETLELSTKHYSMLEDDWIVDAGAFISPMVKERAAQMLLFGERLRNGSISAEISILDSYQRRTGEAAMEASLVVRYS